MAQPIARADTAHRKRLAIATAVALAIGAWGIRHLALRMRDLTNLAESSPEAAVDPYLQLARWVLGTSALGLGVCGVMLVRLGLRGRASGTFPPPGARLLVDQPLTTGRDARRRSTLVLAIGLLATVGAVVLPYWVYIRLVAVLASGP